MTSDLAAQGFRFILYAEQLNREVKRHLERIDQIGRVFEKIGKTNDDQGKELFQLALMIQQESANIQTLLDQFASDATDRGEVQP